MCWLLRTSKDLGGRPPLASRCISLSWLFFHGGDTDEKDPSRISTLSAKNSLCRLCARFLKQQLRRIPIKHPIRNPLRSGFLYCEARLARRSRAHNINRGRIKVPGVSQRVSTC